MSKPGRRRRRPAPQPTAHPGTAHTRTVRLPNLLVGAVLLVAMLLLYTGTYRHPLVFDDRIINPPDLERYLSAWISLRPRWLSYGTFGLNYLWSGMDLYSYRIVNVALHAGVAATAYAFVRRLLTARRIEDVAPGSAVRPVPRLAAFCAAALFAAHPVTVYGVAYLAQRSIVMASLFALLSLLAFLEGCIRRDARLLWLAVFAYFLALAAKEHAVMLPALALALALLVRRPSLALARELAWPLLAFALVAVLTIARMRGLIGSTYEPYAGEIVGAGTGTAYATTDSPYLISVLTQFALFFKYLSVWLLPNPGWMSADLRVPLAKGLQIWPYGAAALAYAGYGAGALALLLRGGRLGAVGFGLLCPWFLYFTEFASTRVQEPFVLYRSYLWMIGLPVVTAALAVRLPAKVLAAGTIVLCAALVPIARDRMDSFATPLKFWDDAVKKSADPGLPFTDRNLSNRAVALMHEGRYEAALPDLEEAIRLNPLNAHAWINRASIHSRNGNMESALRDADEALRLDPAFGEAHAERCAIRMKYSMDSAALEDCSRALELAPEYPIALLNRGVLLARRARMDEALRDFDAILRYDPANAVALYNRAMVLRQLGRNEESLRGLQASCRQGMPAACDALRAPAGPVR